ncbi:MAG: hypothetical protein A2284_11980 [Deltaproteobacteria bacterium RIFOXYA12_FULL_61_11]|nr:MAG: hypothetical protein A2284_11980 [Deltaproteobacteria bacterium RIFOXYA12_FULL_61_11]
MLKLLLKLMPVAAIAVGVVNGKQVGLDAFSAITDMVYISQMRGRLAIINTALVSDQLTKPGWYPRDFKAYIHEVCKITGGGDCSVDPWGKDVSLFVDPRGEFFEIFSPGPDSEPETEDDIFLQTSLER